MGRRMYDISSMAAENPFVTYLNGIAGGDAESYVFFYRVEGQYGFMSQWQYSPFTLNGKRFATAEQFVMYSKAEIFGDTGVASAIMNSYTIHPAQHRRMGRSVRNFEEDVWSHMSLSVAVIANLCKFTHSDEMRNMLMRTNERMIVEASPFDSIWGIGYTAESALANRSRWGQNKLGEALMIVRNMIKFRLARRITKPFDNMIEIAEICANADVGRFDIAMVTV